MLTMPEALDILDQARTDEVVIATMTAGYLWPHVSTGERDFAYTAPMGSAGAVGLGLALARPDLEVLVLDGDGSVLMNLGVLVSIGARAPTNLRHVVFANGVYDITGGQPVPGTGTADLCAIATGAGIPRVGMVGSADEWRTWLAESRGAPGPSLVTVAVDRYPRGNITPEMAHRDESLRRRTGTGFHNLRQALLPA